MNIARAGWLLGALGLACSGGRFSGVSGENTGGAPNGIEPPGMGTSPPGVGNQGGGGSAVEPGTPGDAGVTPPLGAGGGGSGGRPEPGAGGTPGAAGSNPGFGGMGAAGGQPPIDPGPTCPGTAPGCVNDWVGLYGDSGTADGVGNEARFKEIAGLVGVGDFIYIADNHAIRRVNIKTAEVSLFAGNPGEAGAENGSAELARFNNPRGLTSDGTRLWVADADNYVIREIEIASGKVRTLTGKVEQAGWIDGNPDEARLHGLNDITFDTRFLYLVDSEFDLVRRVDPKTGDVLTVAGNGDDALSDGTGTEAQFDAPLFIQAEGIGRLFISDSANNRPRLGVVDRNSDSGLLVVTSPLGGEAGYKDDTGKAAMFKSPRGLAYDGRNLLVADGENHVIRSVVIESNVVTTIAGAAGVAGHRVGIGLHARINSPTALHYDFDTKDLFIAEGTVLRRMIHR